MASKIDWSQEAVGREKLLFFVFLGVLLYLFNTLVWSRSQSTAKEASKQLQTLSAQITSMEQLLEATRKKAEQPAPQAATADAPTPAGDDPRFAPYLRGEIRRSDEVLEEMIRHLTNPIFLQGVELGSFSMERAIDGGTYLRIPFALQVDGPFAATMQYLKRIEELPLLVVFDGLDVLSPDDRRTQLQTTLRSTLYVVKSASALTTPLSDGTATPPAGK